MRFLAVILAGAAADLLTKHWAWRILVNPDSRWSDLEVDKLADRLRVVELLWQPNRGAVFGVGHGQTALFVVFTFLALALLTWLFIDSRRSQAWLQVFLGMVVAGALGNLYDRLAFGHVRDFLRFSLRADWATWGGPDHYLWPYVFNVADVFISVGVAGLFLVWLIALVRRGGAKAERRSDDR